MHLWGVYANGLLIGGVASRKEKPALGNHETSNVRKGEKLGEQAERLVRDMAVIS